MNILGIDHYSVLVSDIEKSLPFYTDILGLSVKDTRPDFSFNDAWLACGTQEIHLMELLNPYMHKAHDLNTTR